MNKQQVEKIIDYFAKDKEAPLYNFTLMCGGYICLQDWLGECPDERAFEEACHIAIPNEVMIGDVLEKMNKSTNLPEGWNGHDIELFILRLWRRLGLNKSLNQIAETVSGCPVCNAEAHLIDCDGNCKKDPHANALFEFLNTLIK